MKTLYVGDVTQYDAPSIQISAKADCTDGKPSMEVCINTDGQCGNPNNCQIIESTGCVQLENLPSYHIKIGCANDNSNGVVAAPITFVAIVLSLLATAMAFL